MTALVDVSLPIPGSAIALATTNAAGAVPSWLPTVANSFDPVVSGLAAGTVIGGATVGLGTVVVSVDNSKSWKKWGSADTNWIPLHAVSYTLGAAAQAWAIPLYCEAAGGFTMEFSGLGINVDHSAYFSIQANGAIFAGAVQGINSNNPTVTGHQGVKIAGGIGIYLAPTDICWIRYECLEPRVSSGQRIVHAKGWHYGTTLGAPYVYSTIDSSFIVPTASGEIASLGAFLSSVGNASMINAGAICRVGNRNP